MYTSIATGFVRVCQSWANHMSQDDAQHCHSLVVHEHAGKYPDYSGVLVL